MPSPNAAANLWRPLPGKRRLHPLAILFPFTSYSRPPVIGHGLHIPRWAVVAVLFGVILVIDAFSVGVSVRDDGAILYQNNNFTRETWLVLFSGIGIAAAWLVARWWSFRWWIADDAIWTSGGVVNTWRRRVTFHRIVVVDRSSTPLGRALGVSRIAIETTAVDQAAPDILLGYLSHAEAARLEHLLISELMFAGEEPESRRIDPLGIDALGWWDLILAGATTFQFGRAIVILYAIALFLLAQLNPTIVIRFELTRPGLPAVQFAIVPFLGVVGVLWLVSTLYFVASFARFRLGKHADWLILETGIIRHSRRLIRSTAIQGLEISRSPLQRSFSSKRAMLRMRLPAYSAPPLYGMVLHPAVTDAALPALTRQIAGMDPGTSKAMCGEGVLPLAAESRNAAIIRWPLRIAAASGMVLALLLVIQPQAWWWALVPMLLAAPCAVTGWLGWKGAGWYAGNGEWLLVQRGTFTVTSTAARIDRIRSIRWSQGLFARDNAPLALAIAVATSGGAAPLSRMAAVLRLPADPSLVRLRNVDANTAREIAVSSGFEHSLPPELGAG